ncbi:hypothetical protein BDW02DRAFT_575997 [Decorospora gaudefroyi]|uniref:Uncharacterized protein n=1 Tax=Decorospora gaudefroyi TaxID=184978 RepID=A0A6A5KJY5_9PLEO|nr:hypothetical protein BDW02DRAFT_575997 [Decorospora gaudefroyi]
MCHWVLRVWQCGDSFFTKYSSCSFDRAAHHPNNPLNPLHPSITPCGLDGTTSQSIADKTHASTSVSSTPSANGPALSRPAPTRSDSPHSEIHKWSGHNSIPTTYPRRNITGEESGLMPVSDIGKACRFGDNASVEVKRCNVFEVVLETKERTICPACARSPKRARLPAHARGCFALS